MVLPPFLGGKPSEYQSTESETKSCWDTGQVYDSTVEQEHPAADAIIDADHAKFGLQPGISGLTRARSHSEHSEQSYITVSEDTATIITCDTHDATTLPNPGSEEQVHPVIALSVTSLGIMGLIFGVFGGLLGEQ